MNWSRLLCSLGLSLGLFWVPAVTSPILADTQAARVKLKLPVVQGRRPIKRRLPCAWRENTLLVMPFKSQTDDARDSIRELNGRIVSTIGQGAMTTWVLAFDDVQSFAKAEKSLTKDEHFHSVQRDYYLHSSAATNDQYYPQQWHLPALNVPNAWDLSLGSSSASIAVIDTGVMTSNFDLVGKLQGGFDSVNNIVGSQTDVNGHGTMVATTAAAIANNTSGTAGPARLSQVIPIRAGQPSGSFSSSALLSAVDFCNQPTTATRLINLSVNGTPPYSIANPAINSTLHTYFQYFHDVKGGLVFNAAGNEALFDTNAMVPYLIVVSAIDETNTLAYFSNWGNCVWFTAPGQNIYCSKGTSTIVSVAGTSFSSPLACSVAALTWGAKPSLTNTQIESIMKSHTTNSGTGWNKFYGYGLPDAAACVAAALGVSAPPPPSTPPDTTPVTTTPKKQKKNPNKLWKRRKG